MVWTYGYIGSVWVIWVVWLVVGDVCGVGSLVCICVGVWLVWVYGWCGCVGFLVVRVYGYVGDVGGCFW